jgi:hypothetical protein
MKQISDSFINKYIYIVVYVINSFAYVNKKNVLFTYIICFRFQIGSEIRELGIRKISEKLKKKQIFMQLKKQVNKLNYILFDL